MSGSAPVRLLLLIELHPTEGSKRRLWVRCASFASSHLSIGAHCVAQGGMPHRSVSAGRAPGKVHSPGKLPCRRFESKHLQQGWQQSRSGEAAALQHARRDVVFSSLTWLPSAERPLLNPKHQVAPLTVGCDPKCCMWQWVVRTLPRIVAARCVHMAVLTI